MSITSTRDGYIAINVSSYLIGAPQQAWPASDYTLFYFRVFCLCSNACILHQTQQRCNGLQVEYVAFHFQH